MKTYREITKTITTKEAFGWKCDCCGKEQERKMDSVTMCHNSWGNDSIDSYTNKDYCSDECYAKLASDFLQNKSYNRYSTAMFDNIEIGKLRALMNYVEIVK